MERPHDQLIVLGASNVRRGLDLIVRAGEALHGGGLDFRVATGHGRSYGTWSNVLGRGLPSILHSGVWRTLEAAPASTRRALITDVGNDIVYGHPPDTILRWVDEAMERLRSVGASLVVTGLPLARLNRVSPVQYEIIRFFLYRRRHFGRDEALRRAAAVDEGLQALAARHGATFVTPEERWYSVDPIHIARDAPEAWATIMRPLFSDAAAFAPLRRALRPRLQAGLLLPQHFSLVGLPIGQGREPRCLRTAAGSHVRLY
jgi:hypothetical protein